jgi:membrane protein
MTIPDPLANDVAATRPPTRSFLQSVLALARAMGRQARQLQLPQAAGSLAFLSLLAIVPMFSIVFAVTTASPAFGRLREALQKFLLSNLFPAAISNTVIDHLNQFAAKASELSLIGTVAFLLTAFVALVTIERTLNRIWGADRPRPLANRLTLYWMLLTLGPLLLGAYLAVHGMVATAWLRGTDLRELRSVWFVILPWITTVGGLMLLYRLLPSATVRWREALAGALLAAMIFELLRSLLGWYVARLPTYTVVYGTFSALPVFLLWLSLGWMALLAGALLAANLRFWGRPGEPHLSRTPAERFHDVHGALLVMRSTLGGDRHGALPVQRLAPMLDHDPQRASQAALLLARLGYVTRFVSIGEPGAAREAPATRRSRLALRWARRWSAARPDAESIWSERWAWADDPRTMTARALFDEIWQPGGQAPAAAGLFPAPFLDEPLVDGARA